MLSKNETNHSLKNALGMEVFSAETIYEIMTCIPEGKVVTYGEIATLMGHPEKARQVGCAMKAAWERSLPCHRVVFADGGLVAGWPEQARLLEAEGVVLKKNGKVDMEKSAWRPLDTVEL